ncbi:hypothetical protein F4802DRAFT_255983 [Xylaria palmicola]|nr:hypothetical protein F4802DRAFT_255983 [Xylaria palmicola]
MGDEASATAPGRVRNKVQVIPNLSHLALRTINTATDGLRACAKRLTARALHSPRRRYCARLGCSSVYTSIQTTGEGPTLRHSGRLHGARAIAPTPHFTLFLLPSPRLPDGCNITSSHAQHLRSNVAAATCSFQTLLEQAKATSWKVYNHVDYSRRVSRFTTGIAKLHSVGDISIYCNRCSTRPRWQLIKKTVKIHARANVPIGPV